MGGRRDAFCGIGVGPPHHGDNRRADKNDGRLLSDILNCDKGARQPAGDASSATPGTVEEDGGHDQDEYREQQCARRGQKQRQARVLAAATLDVAIALSLREGGVGSRCSCGAHPSSVSTATPSRAEARDRKSVV